MEEPIHGGLTYRLAIVAGFEEGDAARLALATAGVDHHPRSRPMAWHDPLYYMTPDQIDRLLTQTERFHFRTPEEALDDMTRRIEEMSRCQLTLGPIQSDGLRQVTKSTEDTDETHRCDAARHLMAAGIALHLLQDVGIPGFPGPHTPYPDPPGLGCEYQGRAGDPRCQDRGSFFDRALAAALSAVVGHHHPPGHGGPLHERDVPASSPENERRARDMLRQAYGFVARLSNAYYRHGPDAELRKAAMIGATETCTPAAEAEIDRALAPKTKREARAYLKGRSTAVKPLEKSYADWVRYQHETGRVLLGEPRWPEDDMDVVGYEDDPLPGSQNPMYLRYRTGGFWRAM